MSAMTKGPRLSIIPGAAVTDRRLEGRDLQVLALLGRYVNTDTGWCNRSQVKMARELCCGRATVQRSISRLIEAGWVEQHPEIRSDGGDRAHSYRVLYDGEHVSPARAPLPTDGQGVPTHERAPKGTTPDNDLERERAGEDEGEDAPEAVEPEPDPAFDAFFAGWPTAVADDKAAARSAWDALSGTERAEAAGRAAEFVTHVKVVLKRSNIVSSLTYLREKRWMRLGEQRKSAVKVADQSLVPPWSRLWWAVFCDRISRGLKVSLMCELARGGRGFGVGIGELPRPEIEESFVRVKVADDAFFAWRRHFAQRGYAVPAPDTAAYVFMPSEWPPGTTPDDDDDPKLKGF